MAKETVPKNADARRTISSSRWRKRQGSRRHHVWVDTLPELEGHASHEYGGLEVDARAEQERLQTTARELGVSTTLCGLSFNASRRNSSRASTSTKHPRKEPVLAAYCLSGSGSLAIAWRIQMTMNIKRRPMDDGINGRWNTLRPTILTVPALRPCLGRPITWKESVSYGYDLRVLASDKPRLVMRAM